MYLCKECACLRAIGHQSVEADLAVSESNYFNPCIPEVSKKKDEFNLPQQFQFFLSRASTGSLSRPPKTGDVPGCVGAPFAQVDTDYRATGSLKP